MTACDTWNSKTFHYSKNKHIFSLEKQTLEKLKKQQQQQPK